MTGRHLAKGLAMTARRLALVVDRDLKPDNLSLVHDAEPETDRATLDRLAEILDALLVDEEDSDE